MGEEERQRLIGQNVLELQDKTQLRICLEKKRTNLVADFQKIAEIIERKLEYQVSGEMFGILGEMGLYESFVWPSKDEVVDVLNRLREVEKEIDKLQSQLSEFGFKRLST